MFHLRQGKRAVVDFYTDFWILAEETGWGENGLRGAFLNSLNKELKCDLSPKNYLNHWMHYHQCLLGWMATSRSTVGKLPVSVDSIGRLPPGDRALRDGRLLGRGANDPAQPGPTFALGLESKAVNGECFFCGEKKDIMQTHAQLGQNSRPIGKRRDAVTFG